MLQDQSQTNEENLSNIRRETNRTFEKKGKRNV